MLVSQLLRSCLRRWYLVLFGLLATAALTWYAFTSIAASYQIQATAVLLPGATTVPEQGNGFLYLGGLTPALEVLVRSVNSDTTAEQILGDDFDNDDSLAEYSVARDLEASGPIMLVTATGPSPDEAREILDKVIAVIPERLASLQADVEVPEGSQMTSLTLSVDDRVEVLTTDRTRLLLGVAAGGLILTVIGTGLIDGLILSARRRRSKTEKLPRYKRRAAEPTDESETDEKKDDNAKPDTSADAPAPAAENDQTEQARLSESRPSV